MYVADRCCIRSVDPRSGNFHTVLGQNDLIEEEGEESSQTSVAVSTEAGRRDGRGQSVVFRDYICMAIDTARDMIYVVDGCDRGSCSGPIRRIFLSVR